MKANPRSIAGTITGAVALLLTWSTITTPALAHREKGERHKHLVAVLKASGEFLPATAKAMDADLLDGLDSTALGTTVLVGDHPTVDLSASATGIITSFALPSGSWLVTFRGVVDNNSNSTRGPNCKLTGSNEAVTLDLVEVHVGPQANSTDTEVFTLQAVTSGLVVARCTAYDGLTVTGIRATAVSVNSPGSLSLS